MQKFIGVRKLFNHTVHNEGMLEVFGITFPFFALVLVGFLAASKKLLPLDSIPGLNIFVLYFALPCMLFRFGLQAPLDRLLNPSVFFTYFVGAILMLSVALLAAKVKGLGWNNASFGALVAAFPNTGFMGVPLLLALFGPSASGTAILTITIDMIFTTSLCIALSRLEGAGGEGAKAALWKALKGMLVNPMPWAIALGVLFCDLHLTFGAPIDNTIKLLSDAASPAALFTLGAVLGRSWMEKALEQRRNQQDSHHISPSPISHHNKNKRIDYLVISFLKLIVHPLIILGLVQSAIKLGFALNPFSLKMMVLIAALPSASNVVMLAQRYGADSERIAKIILCTTTIAFLTFSAFVQAYDYLF